MEMPRKDQGVPLEVWDDFQGACMPLSCPRSGRVGAGLGLCVPREQGEFLIMETRPISMVCSLGVGQMSPQRRTISN